MTLFDPARPPLVDLYSGAGGAAFGYWLAGFQPIGVDNRPQPNYPFPFIQADALAFLEASPLTGVAAIHASPPCQDRSTAGAGPGRRGHPRLIGPTRELLERRGLPWVIENVPPAGGPVEYLRPDLILCACMFGIAELKRTRHFETGGWDTTQLLMRQPCVCRNSVSVNRKGGRINRGPDLDRYVDLATCARLMGISWMTQRELGNAVPPAYTQAIGAALLQELPRCALCLERGHEYWRCPAGRPRPGPGI